MRTKRVDKFKKDRYRKIRKLFLLSIVLPIFIIFIGYIISSLFILPTMTK